MSLPTAIALTLLAYGLMNVGIVLLKKCAPPEPPGGFRGLSWLAAYFTRPLAWWGLAINLGGSALFLLATTVPDAPISLLQPLAAFGLVVVAVLAVTSLGERLGVAEWAAVALLFAGVVALSLSAEPYALPVVLPAGRLFAYTATMAGLGLGAAILLRKRPRPALAEVLYGLLAGVLLGLGYLHMKTASLAWRGSDHAVLLLAVASMGLGLPSGFAMLLRSFCRGRALVVTAVNFVVNQLVVGFGGLYALGEPLPSNPRAWAARVLGYVTIAAGFLILVGAHALPRVTMRDSRRSGGTPLR